MSDVTLDHDKQIELMKTAKIRRNARIKRWKVREMKERAEKAEAERDAAIAALSEEGRKRGEVEAEREDIIAELSHCLESCSETTVALFEARDLILGANHASTRYPRAFAILSGEVDRALSRKGGE